MKLVCPICRRPTNSETDLDFPFCSERCRLVDLGNWASEKYKISSPAAMDESEGEENSEHERPGNRSQKNTSQQEKHDD